MYHGLVISLAAAFPAVAIWHLTFQNSPKSCPPPPPCRGHVAPNPETLPCRGQLAPTASEKTRGWTLACIVQLPRSCTRQSRRGGVRANKSACRVLDPAPLPQLSHDGIIPRKAGAALCTAAQRCAQGPWRVWRQGCVNQTIASAGDTGEAFVQIAQLEAPAPALCQPSPPQQHGDAAAYMLFLHRPTCASLSSSIRGPSSKAVPIRLSSAAHKSW